MLVLDLCFENLVINVQNVLIVVVETGKRTGVTASSIIAYASILLGVLKIIPLALEVGILNFLFLFRTECLHGYVPLVIRGYRHAGVPHKVSNSEFGAQGRSLDWLQKYGETMSIRAVRRQ